MFFPTLGHANIALYISVLDFLHLDSLLLPHSPSRLAFSVFVPDLLTPDFLLSLQHFSRVEISSSVHDRFRLESTVFLLDLSRLEVFFPLQTVKRSGFSISISGMLRADSSLPFLNLVNSGFLLLTKSHSHLDSPVSVLVVSLGSTLFSRSLACLESVLSLVSSCSFGSLSSAFDAGKSDSPAFLQSLCRVDSAVLTFDLLHLDFFSFAKSLAYFGSFLLVLDLEQLDALSSMQSNGRSESFTTALGKANPGISVFALDFVNTEETSFVQNVQRLSSTLPAESLTLGLSFFVRSFANLEPVVSSWGMARFGVSLLILATMTLESSPSPKSNAYFGSLSLTLGCSRVGGTLLVLSSSSFEFSTTMKSFGRSDLTMSAPDLSSFGLVSSSRDFNQFGLMLLIFQLSCLASSLPALDVSFLDSSTSLQRLGPAGPSIPLCGVVCLATLLLSLDFSQTSLSLLTRSLGRPGSAPAALDFSSSGFFLILQQCFCVELSLPLSGGKWLELALPIFDLLHLDLPSPVRLCRLGFISFPFGAVQIESISFVSAEASSGSPALMQSTGCLESFVSTLSAVRPGLLTFVLMTGNTDLLLPPKSTARIEPHLLVGILSRFGFVPSPLDVSHVEFLLPPKCLFRSLSCNPESRVRNRIN